MNEENHGGEVATWSPLDDNGSAEVRVNGKRITTMPSYSGAEEVAQRINAALAPSEQPEPVACDTGREAIWKVVHEVWQLLDDAETDSAGITTPNQERWNAVSEAMDELEALVPDSEGPFWGGYPVNYLWPKGAAK